MRDGWQEARLGDVCKVIAGQSPKGSAYNNHGDGLPFHQGKKYFRETLLGDSNTWTTQITKEAFPGDILMSVRAPVGPINFTDQHMCIGRGLAAIRATEKVDRMFLFHWLSFIQSEIQGNEGAVFASINKKQIESIGLPLPSLAEQKRIVAILDEAFAGIANAVANTEKNLANARELYESYLSTVFSQRGVGWADYRLGDIVTRLTNGYVGPTRGIYQTTGVPYLLARHVKNNRLNFDGKTFITREFNAKNKKSILKYEDILLVQSGHIGHSAVVTQEHEGHNCHAMIVLTPLNDIVTGPYLSLFFNSPLMQEEFQRIRSGSTVPHLTCREVKELVVTAPKVAEQRSIVERSQEIESRVLELVSIGQQKLNALTELKQCLLQKAFSGELTVTPQEEIETALA